ncbi:MAG: gliding motility-associated C-terminal domain-containing protein [Mucilaginibacter sp.]
MHQEMKTDIADTTLKQSYMKYLLLVFLTVVAFKTSRAQTVSPAIVNVAGNTFTQSDITYEWSVGEMALVETMITTKAIITNGLLQSDAVGKSTTSNNVTSVVAANILTPNGDGKNDYWVVKDISSYPNNTVTVFDRAGRIVYTRHGYANDWGGTLNGAPLAEDTYYYFIDLGIGKPVIKGFITIIRDR